MEQGIPRKRKVKYGEITSEGKESPKESRVIFKGSPSDLYQGIHVVMFS